MYLQGFTLPKTYRRIVANKLTSDFKETKIEIAPLPEIQGKEFGRLRLNIIEDDEVMIKNEWVGVNASDINFISGKYTPGAKPPLYPGFECVGKLVGKGRSVPDKLALGGSCAYTGYGCFGEYVVTKAKGIVPLPYSSPDFIPLIVSGLTAAISLDKVGEMKSGETVLVTAAAGATGLFAVQLAKLAGNHVIGTCSSDDKVDFLKKLGCDRVINYKKEDVFQVLKNEYPKGIDLVYESVGGKLFDVCVNNIAIRGRIIVIGMISGYQDQSAWSSNSKPSTPLPSKLLAKSASVRGFFLLHYGNEFKSYTAKLTELIMSGKLQAVVDQKPFHQLEGVYDAIDYMYKGGNTGKIVVNLSNNSKL